MTAISSATLRLPAKPAKASVPRAVPVLLAATLAYLCLEIPFAGRLVEAVVTGGPALAEVEREGRVLSGFALALVAWGWLLSPARRLRPAAKAVLLPATLGASLAAMQVGQPALVSAIADHSAPATRLSALRGAVAAGAARPVSIPSGGDLVTAAAALPNGALRTDALAALPDRNPAVRSFAASLVPDAAAYREGIWKPAMTEARRSYGTYARAAESLAAAPAAAARAASKGYEDLWAEIGRKRITGIGNAQVNVGIAMEVRRRGVPVTQGWDPRDEASFRAAATGKAMDDARASYRAGVAAALGQGADLPPDIQTFDAFLARKPVQARLRAALGLPGEGPALASGYTDTAFASLVHRPFVAKTSAAFAGALAGDAGAVSDGGAFAKAGRDAVKAAVATALALFLSAAGAFGHVAKAANHAMRVLGIGRGARVAAGAALAACILAGPSTPPGHPASPGLAGAALDWSVGAHAALMPFGDAIGRALPAIR